MHRNTESLPVLGVNGYEVAALNPVQLEPVPLQGLAELFARD